VRLGLRALILVLCAAGSSWAGKRRPLLRIHGPSPEDAPPPTAKIEHPPEVLFTFDDGPDLRNTPKVLAELDRHGIKAIFFVNGWHFDKDERAKALLREEMARGHYVGNHTYSHRILCKHLPLAPREIDHNQELLVQVLGFRPELLRTPYGQHCKKLVELVAERGFSQIGWDIDAQEWRAGKTEAEVSRFIIGHLARAHGRAIVLLHDTHAVTVAALPKILEWLTQHPEIKILEPRVLLKQPPPGPAPAARMDGVPASALLRALGWLGIELSRAMRGLERPLGAPLVRFATLML
jgi:peptidoglycan/xylan/chitin deacetylase (PgdA/CDA1 family)